MTKPSPSQLIKNKAHDLKIDLIGFTKAIPHPDFDFYKKWLDQNYQASMKWMEKSIDKRSNPDLVLKNAESMISCGLIYYRGHPKSIDCKDKDKAWISNYAWGDDYHEVFLDKLKELEKFIIDQFPNNKTRSYVDTGPILERSYAKSAGLGWIGKNTCLINTKKGSYFFLGEIITDLELEYDDEEPDHCGKCTRCIDACPTDALTAYELNSNQCISYLTIEHRDEINPDLQDKIGHHLVGCDICQDVCPWNNKIKPGDHPEFDPREGLFHPKINELENLSQEEFSKKFRKSPIKRVKLKGLERNLKLLKINNLF
jgi:epoxyqueuosine reductase